MRTLITFGIALLAATLQSTSGAGISSDRAISPAVVVSWMATGSAASAQLDLMVLWRGTPGWFLKGNTHSGGGGGDSSRRMSQRLQYGGIDMTVSFDAGTRATRVQDLEVKLNGDNVVLVDDIDAPGGPKIVGTKRVDPEMADWRRIDLVIRRSPELHAFMRCEVRMPDARQQSLMDLLCSQIIPR